MQRGDVQRMVLEMELISPHAHPQIVGSQLQRFLDGARRGLRIGAGVARLGENLQGARNFLGVGHVSFTTKS